MRTFRPMLAVNYDERAIRFPVIAQPKIDGVRALVQNGIFTARTLKPFRNNYLTAKFSLPELNGFDGELAAHKETHPDLCRLTTSATNTIEGEPYVIWHLFDCITADNWAAPYRKRLEILQARVDRARDENPFLWPHLRVVPSRVVRTFEELEQYEAECLDEGYEGVMLRDPTAPYKQGRSTLKEGGLVRIKRFLDGEGYVIGVEQGQTNMNESSVNALGYTERSTRQENMLPNGMVGRLIVRLDKNITRGNVLVFDKRDHVTISPGKLTQSERIHYWQNQDQILGRHVKFKFFPKGIKDKLRHATFQCFLDGDLSGSKV